MVYYILIHNIAWIDRIACCKQFPTYSFIDSTFKTYYSLRKEKETLNCYHDAANTYDYTWKNHVQWSENFGLKELIGVVDKCVPHQSHQKRHVIRKKEKNIFCRQLAWSYQIPTNSWNRAASSNASSVCHLILLITPTIQWSQQTWTWGDMRGFKGPRNEQPTRRN